LPGDGLVEIENTLEICAENIGDIVPEVYERFFALSPEAKVLMGHADEFMCGRMLNEVLTLFLNQEHLAPGAYLDWELDNHLLAYQATSKMYDAFFQALIETVRGGVGDAWTQADELAWNNAVSLILNHVHAHPAVKDT